MIPSTFFAGDTVTWTDTSGNYPSPTWTMTYYLINDDNKETVVGVANAPDHDFTITDTDSSGFVAGLYQWQQKVDDGSTTKTICTGTIEVLSSYDIEDNLQCDLSDWETIMVDLLQAYKTHLSSNGAIQSYSIGGRAVTYKTLAEIIQALNNAKLEVSKEKRLKEIRAGGYDPSVIRVRF